MKTLFVIYDWLKTIFSIMYLKLKGITDEQLIAAFNELDRNGMPEKGYESSIKLVVCDRNAIVDLFIQNSTLGRIIVYRLIILLHKQDRPETITFLITSLAFNYINTYSLGSYRVQKILSAIIEKYPKEFNAKIKELPKDIIVEEPPVNKKLKKEKAITNKDSAIIKVGSRFLISDSSDEILLLTVVKLGKGNASVVINRTDLNNKIININEIENTKNLVIVRESICKVLGEIVSGDGITYPDSTKIYYSKKENQWRYKRVPLKLVQINKD